MDKTDAGFAWHLYADKLADRVRNMWRERRKLGKEKMGSGSVRESGALEGLREKGFFRLVGLNYIIQWRGGKDPDTLAGEFNVIWKVANGDKEIDLAATVDGSNSQSMISSLDSIPMRARKEKRNSSRSEAHSRKGEMFKNKLRGLLLAMSETKPKRIRKTNY